MPGVCVAAGGGGQRCYARRGYHHRLTLYRTSQRGAGKIEWGGLGMSRDDTNTMSENTGHGRPT